MSLMVVKFSMVYAHLQNLQCSDASFCSALTMY